jgi:two-component system, chemotaxis family, response regulator Rcp1
MTLRPISILLVEDNPGDVELIRETLSADRVHLEISVAVDGVEAIDFLRRRPPFAGAPRPDLILLDLNLPRQDGRQVLAEIKTDSDLKRIPIVVLTSSEAENDVLRSYNLGANCYLTKPVDLRSFRDVVRSVEGFWFTVVKLPDIGAGRG